MNLVGEEVGLRLILYRKLSHDVANCRRATDHDMYTAVRGGGREFYLGGGAELLKCIDRNEDQALRRGGGFEGHPSENLGG